LISLRLRCSIHPRSRGSAANDERCSQPRGKKEVNVLKIIRVVIGAFLAIGLSSVASAQSFDTRNLFFGGGLSQNKIDVSGATSKNGTGYQFFGGYTFGQVAPQMRVDAELGYMDTGT